MDTKERLRNIVYYLMSVKNLQNIKNIDQYEKVFWQKNLIKNGCLLNVDKDNNNYIEINKECKSIYDQISRLNLKLQKNCDKLQLLWGYCFLTWKVNGNEIAHPLFTCKAELSLDEENKKIFIKSIGKEINVELNVLGYENFNNLENALNIKKDIEESGLNIKDEEDLKEKINLILEQITTKKINRGVLKKNKISLKDFSITRHPAFYNEPIIILRDNDNEKWNVEFKNILDKINMKKNIPLTVQALVNEENLNESKEEIELWKNTSKQLLYPLDYSEEQANIAKRLSENFGVVVEGPSGSGKTQSLANLICHLISHNKRVLVTGQQSKTLKILSSKLPEDIKPLCFNVEEDDTSNLENMDILIKMITDNLDVDTQKLEYEINNLGDELNLNRENQRYARNKLNGNADLKDQNIKFFGKLYKVSNIMNWIEDNKSQYSWIEDDIPLNDKPIITDAKFSRLIYLISNIDKKEIKEFNKVYGLIYNMPSCSEFITKIKRMIELEKNYNEYRRTISEWCVSYNVDYDYDYIVSLLETCRKTLNDIKEHWTYNILECVRKGQVVREVLQQIILRCNYYIKKLGSISKSIAGHNIQLPKDIELSVLTENFNIICDQYKQKNRLSKVFKVFHSQSVDILKKCFVDSKAIETKEEANIVKLYIEKCEIQENLKNLWNDSMTQYKAKEVDKLNMNLLAELESSINKINTILNWDILIKNKVIHSMKKVLFLNEIDWYSEKTYLSLKKGIFSIKYISEYENLKSDINNIGKLISNMDGFRNICKFINDRNVDKLSENYKKIDRLKGIGPCIRELDYLMETLRSYCPKLVNKLLDEEDKLNMLSKYKNFSKAWLLRQFEILLEKENSKYIPENVKKYINIKKEKEIKLVRQIVSKKSWYNLLSKIKEKEKRSFYAWREAVKRIGKGVGKYSNDYMRLAKKEMSKFKNIIPVWIMPLDKVVENFGLYENIFDVVIIDDGSESNIFSLSALFRAKKAVIVGDDQESNINSIAYQESNITNLMDNYLKDIPNFEWFDMKTSIYSTALRVFPNKINLKEQFRCLSDIIKLNDHVNFEKDIIPLGKFNSNCGLDPIKNISVDGERDKIKAININEANAIVDKIYNCCKNPKYKGMSIGVISLLGDAQYELIEKLLKQKIGQDEINSRNILCGNPNLFKGDERDIIFLSMVIAKNVKFTSLTKDIDVRRFNIAVTRAKKQIWLFHSVDLKELNPDCVRYKLIRYFENYSINNNNVKKFKVIA